VFSLLYYYLPTVVSFEFSAGDYSGVEGECIVLTINKRGDSAPGIDFNLLITPTVGTAGNSTCIYCVTVRAIMYLHVLLLCTVTYGIKCTVYDPCTCIYACSVCTAHNRIQFAYTRTVISLLRPRTFISLLLFVFYRHTGFRLC